MLRNVKLVLRSPWIWAWVWWVVLECSSAAQQRRPWALRWLPGPRVPLQPTQAALVPGLQVSISRVTNHNQWITIQVFVPKTKPNYCHLYYILFILAFRCLLGIVSYANWTVVCRFYQTGHLNDNRIKSFYHDILWLIRIEKGPVWQTMLILIAVDENILK